MFVSYFSLITVWSHDAIIWPHVWVSFQIRSDKLCLNHNKGGLLPDSRWSQPLPLPSACLTRNSFRPGAVSSLRAFHGFLRRSFPPLPARLLLTSEQGRYAKRLIPADFALFPPQLSNLLHWFRIDPNFWQLNPELAQEIMQRIDWLTRKWWSWMQFWQNSYFDATAWYWEADIELSAQKPFWSVSQKLLALHCTANGFIKLALIALILI